MTTAAAGSLSAGVHRHNVYSSATVDSAPFGHQPSSLRLAKISPVAESNGCGDRRWGTGGLDGQAMELNDALWVKRKRKGKLLDSLTVQDHSTNWNVCISVLFVLTFH